MENKTAEEIVGTQITDSSYMITGVQAVKCCHEFAASQNAHLVKSKEVLWNKLNEFNEAFGCATEITPKLLISVRQTLKEYEK